MTEPMTMFKLRDEMSKETENVVNRLHRHCKIGRVEKKMQTLNGWQKPPNSWFTDRLNSLQTRAGGYVPTTSSGDVPLVPAHGVMM